LSFVPHSNLFVSSNVNSVLRVCSYTGESKVKQKLKMQNEVLALQFDPTGVVCLGGTKAGTVVGLCYDSETGLIDFAWRKPVSLGRDVKAVTNIAFTSRKVASSCRPRNSESGMADLSESSNYAQYAVMNCNESGIVICQLYYNAHYEYSLVVQKRFWVQQTLLPIKSAFSCTAGGSIISGSEDANVYVFTDTFALNQTDRMRSVDGAAGGSESLTRKGSIIKHSTTVNQAIEEAKPREGANKKKPDEHSIKLCCHDYPVICTAANRQETMMVSGDAGGHIIFWSR
jgi:hypothetical protein